MNDTTKPGILEAAKAVIAARDNYGWSSEVDAALETLRAAVEAKPAELPGLSDGQIKAINTVIDLLDSRNRSSDRPGDYASRAIASARAALAASAAKAVPEGWAAEFDRLAKELAIAWMGDQAPFLRYPAALEALRAHAMLAAAPTLAAHAQAPTVGERMAGSLSPHPIADIICAWANGFRVEFRYRHHNPGNPEVIYLSDERWHLCGKAYSAWSGINEHRIHADDLAAWEAFKRTAAPQPTKEQG